MKLVKPKNPPKYDPEVKRFYLPGYRIEGVCAKCGVKVVMDLSDDYFIYPVLNAVGREFVYCENDHEVPFKYRISVSLELVK